MNDTIVDQPLFPPAAIPPSFAQAPGELLLPDNPAEGWLDADDWRRVAHQLELSRRELSVAHADVSWEIALSDRTATQARARHGPRLHRSPVRQAQGCRPPGRGT